MNITTTTVTTRKTTVGMLRSEIEDIILVHLRDKCCVSGDSPEFIWAGNGNGGVSIDFVDEDVELTPEAPTTVPSSYEFDWKPAPPWANWVAMDADGLWYLFENKPCTLGGRWQDDTEGKVFRIVPNIASSDWRLSLQQRPVTTNDSVKEQPDNEEKERPDGGWISWTATDDSVCPDEGVEVKFADDGIIRGNVRSLNWTSNSLNAIVAYRAVR